MAIWQADFYRRPLKDAQGHDLWELLICTPDRSFEYSAFCPQPDATADWLAQQFQAAASNPTQWPERIQVFRPQALSLIALAGQTLGIAVEATRRTPALKQWLQQRRRDYPTLPGYTGQPYQPTELDLPPPQPIPEQLWGQAWQFATLAARELETGLLQRPIPILQAPDWLLPSRLQLAPQTPIPGVLIYGGRHSMPLARWLAAQPPVSLQAIRGEPSGLVLTAGLSDRWILLTYDDPEVIAAAEEFERRKQGGRGLHFLLVQPDASGVTSTGLWLLQPVD